jgi:hypothetical protein
MFPLPWEERQGWGSAAVGRASTLASNTPTQASSSKGEGFHVQLIRVMK